MSRWFDEARLSRLPIEQIGAAFYIREMMRNKLNADYYDLREVFGPGTDGIFEGLRRAGVLVYERNGRRVSVSIRASGDKKRERCAEIGRRKRQGKKVSEGKH